MASGLLVGLLVGLVIGLLAWQAGDAQAQDSPADRFAKHLERARAYTALDQYANAAQEFLAAYEIDPKPALLFNAGRAYWLGELFDAALAEYARYLEHESGGSLADMARQAFFERAEAAWSAGDTARALALHERYIRYTVPVVSGRVGGMTGPGGAPTPDPGLPPDVRMAQLRFFEHAESVWNAGQRVEALAHYQRFLDLAPTHEHASVARKRPFEVAEALWHAGEKDRALDLYEQFARAVPQVEESARARARIFERGETFWQRGERERAVAYYERYLRIEVADEIADQARARIAEYTRDQELAAFEKEQREARAAEAAGEDQAETRAAPVPEVSIGESGIARQGRISGSSRPFWQRVSGGVSAAMDYKARGAAAQVGMGLDTGLWGLELRAAGLLGPTLGAYLGGARRFGLGERLDFTLGMGVPVFFSSGARFGVRGSGGIEWKVMRHMDVVVELGVEHIFDPEWDREGTALVPLVGVRAY